ncbi:Glycosidase [Caldanaerobius fijiensis DSM 17918]|uniref:Glycosidase n=1 Tax=Caldanaerobius fijiensis DSM 17918 TaxID=1121256 RepID=A0A1M4ZWQ3_9THEO|nr:alpha-glycosidase [Caldanaerobius fijiensis]SHF22463.1 Glycosidase [Caldanaerobius fijiensis DSM 17918]
MHKEAIYHRAEGSYAYPLSENEIRLILKAKRGDLKRCYVLYDDRYTGPGTEKVAEMTKVCWDTLYDYFQVDIYSDTRRIRYFFYLEGENEHIWYAEGGFSEVRPLEGHFQYPYICKADLFKEPLWTKGAVIYQIFPDRFYNGDKNNDPPGCKKWGEAPDSKSFFGGDLKGVMLKLDYLKELGIDAIYFTPIFESPSNHKYDTTDYYRVDKAFGDLDTLRQLVDEAHQRGIKIILDAVFNHCGKDFWAFKEAVSKGPGSRYWQWFNIYSYPVKVGPNPNYETFANGVYTMPKLMTYNPEVREYLLGVIKYWTKEVNLDGWRLDVANEIDHSFWREFRKIVKDINPQAFILGEVWHDALKWLEGDQFDSVMNYPWRDLVVKFFAKNTIDAEAFDCELARLRMMYTSEVVSGLVNLIDSHDTPRFLTLCKGDKRKLMLAVVFQMTYPGIPMVYYGDEIGMEGDNDPDCRRTMIWEEDKQDRDIYALYKKLISIRHSFPWLANSIYRTWHVDPLKNIYGYIREGKEERIWVLINNSGLYNTLKLPLESGGKVVDLLKGEYYDVKDGMVTIALQPYSAVVLTDVNPESVRRE